MHPSREIIFFTTASGAGYGLLALLGIFSLFNLLPLHQGFAFTALFLTFLLITSGLLASTLHLGHPERMLLSLSQWRSSWLSREAWLALFTYPPGVLFALGWAGFGNSQGLWADMGALAALSAITTVFCTSMIYASLKAIPRWHSVWVPVNYLALSIMSGAVLLHFIAVLFHKESTISARIVMVTIILALIGKLAYWNLTRNKGTSDIQSATRLGNIGEVRALDPPHTTPNYLQKEMGYQIANNQSCKMREFTLFWGFIVPFFLTLIGRDAPSIAWAIVFAFVTVLSVGAGIVAERWLFFAEAKHKSSLYYGESRS